MQIDIQYCKKSSFLTCKGKYNLLGTFLSREFSLEKRSETAKEKDFRGLEYSIMSGAGPPNFGTTGAAGTTPISSNEDVVLY